MATRRLTAILSLTVLPLLLPACASIEATQPRFMDLRQANTGVNGYRVREALTAFAAPLDTARGNRTRRQYRDDVVRLYLIAIEAQYGDFRTAVESEGREFGLGTDLAMAAFTGWASVARESIVNELSAINSGIGNAQGAFSRNLYGSRTLPAVLASMDAQRLRIIARIEQGLSRTETEYPLSAAFFDLAQLESAGSLSRASENLTGSAVEARQAAERELASVVQACDVVEADVVDLNTRVSNFVDDLAGLPGAPPVVAPDTQAAREQALREVGLLAGLQPATVIAPPADVARAIRLRLAAGVNGRCAAADVQALIERIEQQTRRTVQ